MKKLLLSFINMVCCTAFAQQISAGYSHSLFLCADSTVMVSGWGQYGQLGNGTTNPANIINPIPVNRLTKVTAVKGGYTNSYFLKSDSTVWACGNNGNGQLGDGTNISKDTIVKVNSINSVIAMAGGTYYSVFLKRDSTVWACGDNSVGQLGDSTTINKNIPIKINRLSSIIAIAAGSQHTIFLKSNGTAWTCGDNSLGQLGDGTDTARHIPVRVNGLTNIIAIAADINGQQSFFLKNDGTVWACGENSFGQLGDATTVNRYSPVQVAGLTNIVAVSAGQDHAVFLKNDGTAWTCGTNSNGQLGIGTFDNNIHSTPAQVTSLSGIRAVVSGGLHTLFLKNDGAVWGCGDNGGALADGTDSLRATPVQAIGLCTIFTNSIKQNFYKENISIYPNPAQNNFTIETNYADKQILSIFDINGKQVLSQTINGTTIIDVSHLSAGVYNISMANNQSVTNKKLIIVK